MRLAAAVAAAASAAFLVACADGFQRPSPESMKLGEPSRSELIARIGEPGMKGKIERNGREVEAVSWIFASDFEKPHGYDGIIPGRTLTLFFDQERLVGYEYNSTIERDHTDFSLVRLREIVRGKTTREQVREFLGAPAGALTFPVVDTPGGAMVYSYRELRRRPFGQPVPFSKTLLIKFNQDGTVNDYTYTTQGTP
jgi:hypothetical protein